MNYLLFVSLVALTLAAGSAGSAPHAVAQSPVMQKGISVQMAVTSNATPMPDADSENALIVTVTNDGSVYFGINRITSDALPEKVRSTPFRRGQNLYIKADGRTPYANVLKVLDATRTGGIAPQVLLTSQAESSAPGTVVPPKGLEVLLAPPSHSGTESTVVQIDRGRRAPTMKIDNQATPWATLQSALIQVVKNKSGKMVLVKADGRLSFAQVAQVIDACRSTGVKVVLATPML
jgi:biopolymer transport protein TolR